MTKNKTIYIKDKSEAFCPTAEHENWNLHPRVYIDLKNGNRCPYCSNIFKIKK